MSLPRPMSGAQIYCSVKVGTLALEPSIRWHRRVLLGHVVALDAGCKGCVSKKTVTQSGKLLSLQAWGCSACGAIKIGIDKLSLCLKRVL